MFCVVWVSTATLVIRASGVPAAASAASISATLLTQMARRAENERFLRSATLPGVGGTVPSRVELAQPRMPFTSG